LSHPFWYRMGEDKDRKLTTRRVLFSHREISYMRLPATMAPEVCTISSNTSASPSVFLPNAQA
jgi:hypothetical protein